MGESVDHFVSAGFLRGYLYAFFVLQFIQVPEADVFSSRQLIPDEILEDDGDSRTQTLKTVVPQVNAVQHDATRSGIIKPSPTAS